MTQRQLGDKIGVTERSVAGWEGGERIPFAHIPKLAQILKRPEDWILHGDEGSPLTINQQLSNIQAELMWIREHLEGNSKR